MLPDTIAAPITAPGRAAVSVIRVSGPLASTAVEKLVPKHRLVLAHPRQMHLVSIADRWGSAPTNRELEHAEMDEDGTQFEPPTQSDFPEDFPVLDVGLVVYFPSPKSFTGEDCVEFNLHGSPFLAGRLLENLAALGIRLANPGEFTQRAFLNGQVDLSQAEAVADIIAAETQAQARIAQQQLEGRLSKAILELGSPLRDLLAEIEAYIDFPDEGIDPMAKTGWLRVIRSVRMVLRSYIESYSTGKLYREGVHIALAGYPNAGKSSLLNAICNEDRAIVTPIPGTTRDSIEVRVTLGGLQASFWDTAGIVKDSHGDRTVDPVETLGIERSWNHVKNSDLVLYVVNHEDDIEGQIMLIELVKKEAKKVFLVLNKADLLDRAQLEQVAHRLRQSLELHLSIVSAKDRDGIDQLIADLEAELVGSEDPTGSVLITNQRHHEALQTADKALAQVEAALSKSEVAAEFVSLDIRGALGALQDIIGVTHSEDILGLIFSKFCIGK